MSADSGPPPSLDPPLPTGIVTFAFTDIEGSTRRWEQDRLAMQEALLRHDSIVRGEVTRHRGHVFKTIGDAFCCVFSRPKEAVASMVAVQRAIAAEEFRDVGGLRVRVALHTGTADERDGDYFGPTINRVARMVSIAHGGQVILSEITRAIARGALPPRTSIVDLGWQRLKDLAEPEHVWQLDIDGLASTFPPLRSIEPSTLEHAIKGNLPPQLTSFIGRESEIIEIAALLEGRRMVTLTGSGGVGKTRTALRIGDALAERLPDGVWFVELAPLSDSQLVPAAIFRALQFHETASHRPPVESLSRFLKAKAILLILDNCEHVIDQVAIVADALLQFCPRLQILATSREPIRISGEHTYRLPSLLAPSNRARISAVEAASYPAINLFVDRARAVDQRFALNDENASIISDICLRVDGIPLAIELAAARVRTFSVTEIARRLDERFRILTGGTRTAVPRQRTMWATIDWSHDLLDGRERILLRRLSVFSGGWTMEAAQVVCADSSLDEHEVFALMVALIEKSLVAAEVTSDNARYRLLESTQAYALEKVKQSGEHEAIAQRHADWVAGLAVDLRKAFSTLPREQWRKAIEPEVDNIRAALSYASDINDTALTVRILWLARINNAVTLREADPRTFLERRRKKENSVGSS